MTQANRRELLTGVAGAVASIPGVTFAQDSISKDKITKNYVNVVDMKVTLPNLDSKVPESVGCGRIPHSVMDSGQLFPITIPSRTLSNFENIIRVPEPDTEFGFSNKGTYYPWKPYKKVEFNGVSEKLANIENEYKIGKIEVIRNRTGFEIYQEGDLLTKVQDGDSRTLPLESRNIEIPTFSEPETVSVDRPGLNKPIEKMIRKQTGTKSIKATPQLDIRSHSNVPSFSSESGTVLPISQKAVIQDLIPNDSTEVAQLEQTKLIHIPKNYTEVVQHG